MADQDVKATRQRPTVPLRLVEKDGASFREFRDDATTGRWIGQSGFAAEPGTFCLVPDADGGLARVLVGVESLRSMRAVAGLPFRLPEGRYHIENDELDEQLLQQMAIAWVLSSYRFTRYKTQTPSRKPAELVIPKNCNARFIAGIGRAFRQGRDLINTPAEDMGPVELAAAFSELAKEFNATIDHTVGTELVKKGYHAVYAVGRASRRAPRLIDLQWGDPRHPAVTLVGKGVCFDSGGLDLKSAASMALMKKDMGGAAYVYALARLIMEDGLSVRLRVLVPAVDNVVDGGAYRPGDIIKMRNGMTVEVDNTDAEGRLILADALVDASISRPDLLIDFATLTGAARAALGPDVAAMFSRGGELLQRLQSFADLEEDPMWPLPLYRPYRKFLNSDIADCKNAGKSPYAGAITAALFLEQFVAPNVKNWLHCDVAGWNLSEKPDHPPGAELTGLRAVFAYIRRRFSIQH